ncbi:MAG: hypothetical protein ACPHK8_07020, partial [Thermoplasmatota archaeon]
METKTLGKSLWRIWPFVKPYKARIAVGLITNGFARLFDLLPLVLIGFLVDKLQGTAVADIPL